MKSFLLLFSILAVCTLALRADEKRAAAPVKNVTAAEAAKLLEENPKIVVLDLRTPEEFAGGHIKGAKNIDFNAPDFAQQVAALDPQGTYLFHCAGGGRSTRAVPVLEGKKFGGLYHLDKGFKAWETAGKPVAK